MFLLVAEPTERKEMNKRWRNIAAERRRRKKRWTHQKFALKSAALNRHEKFSCLLEEMGFCFYRGFDLSDTNTSRERKIEKKTSDSWLTALINKSSTGSVHFLSQPLGARDTITEKCQTTIPDFWNKLSILLAVAFMDVHAGFFL